MDEIGDFSSSLEFENRRVKLTKKFLRVLGALCGEIVLFWVVRDRKKAIVSTLDF
jgi:hypothetical protein